MTDLSAALKRVFWFGVVDVRVSDFVLCFGSVFTLLQENGSVTSSHVCTHILFVFAQCMCVFRCMRLFVEVCVCVFRC